MDVASALAVGQYDIAMWNLVLVLSWAGRLDVRSFVDLHYRDAHVSTCVLPVWVATHQLLPCIQAFHKTRAHALSFLAQSCATVARVMALLRDSNVMAAATATGEADIKGSTLKDKIAWSKAVIQQQVCHAHVLVVPLLGRVHPCAPGSSRCSSARRGRCWGWLPCVARR